MEDPASDFGKSHSGSAYRNRNVEGRKPYNSGGPAHLRAGQYLPAGGGGTWPSEVFDTPVGMLVG